ncbi:hypothetical protein BGW36DRAFT_358185 [Talaromyces proteolyticus]|uniref:Uncharacterized protein n=1 Tax=Talaromyces proteolyticus TaxID=1131652 RepID=A0AAD4KWU8_9EURO|nr:uncharacterized protein BGW36DRAFT_358185 [Talaromyces proteolyticus]KAH8698662.1 hypothetical protein BGW36DRAFT_358185 [Talaromyces proteolyticus]
MAASVNKTTKNLNGTWILPRNQNKELSDSADPGLQIQDIGYFIRSIICVVPITIEVKQYEGLPKLSSTVSGLVIHIDIDQRATSVSPSEELRCLGNLPRNHSDWLFGNVKEQTCRISFEEINDEFLKSSWLVEEYGKSLIRSYTISEDKGWQVYLTAGTW